MEEANHVLNTNLASLEVTNRDGHCVSRQNIWEVLLHTLKQGGEVIFLPDLISMAEAAQFVLLLLHFQMNGRIMVVSIVTRLWTTQLRNRGLTPSKGKTPHFFKATTLALSHSQPPIQWVTGVSFPGYKAAKL
jgi:hypothetical protein